MTRPTTARHRRATAAALLALALLTGAVQTQAQDTRAGEAEQARDAKAATLTAEHRSLIERALYTIEDDLLLERWLAPPRGVFVRLGGIGEGAGFGVGPAVRYNVPAFDFRASAAGSIKQYVIAEAALRFPGTPGTNEYVRPDGPFVELAGRYRDFPQEDFFGLGPASDFDDRSNYFLRERTGTVTGGLARRNLTAGLTTGYTVNRADSGTDDEMPSITRLFSAAEAPGLRARPEFLTIGPFVRFQTRDRAINKPDGGEYVASFTRFDDRSAGGYSFDRWDVDLRQFVVFGQRTRTIALRAWAASTTPRDGNEVPFYLQPWLGGARTIRSFKTFRFRDRSALLLQGEYRWRINEFVNGALFYDAGAVARALDRIGHLEQSWGGGLRLGGRMGSAVRLDVAFGSGEGWRTLLRFDDVF